MRMLAPPGVDNLDPHSDFSPSDESTSHPSFHPEEVDHLLKVVRATVALEEPKEEKSIEDKMFEGLESKKKMVFPVHKNIWGLIQREWNHSYRDFYSQGPKEEISL